MSNLSCENPGNISIQYATEARFQKPAPPIYSKFGSILSILSLLFMAVLSTLMFFQLYQPGEAFFPWLSNIFAFLKPPKTNLPLASWALLPFAFTIFGSVLGMLFELWLLITGQWFQQTNTKFHTFIRNIRLLNLAPVVATILFFFCCILLTDPSMRLVALFLSGAIAFGLGFALFFNGAPTFVFLMLAGLQLIQIILVLTHSIDIGGPYIKYLLIGQSVLQLVALLTTTATPMKSTMFHTLSTISGILLYIAIVNITNEAPYFSHDVAVILPSGSALYWGFISVCGAALVLVAWFFPKVYGNFRTSFTNAIWTLQYFVLVSAKRFPKPYKLSTVYDNNKPQPSRLKPYYLNHPQFLVQDLNIPSVVNIEKNVTIFKKLITKAKKGFSAIAILDHYLPQSNVNIPLKNKQRMELWSDGSEYWPAFFHKNLFGYTIPNRGHYEKAPKSIIEAFKNGQLLASLCEFGIGSTFIRASKVKSRLVADFSHLDQLETRSDFESYGGIANFKINQKDKKLELISVVAPNSSKQIKVNPNDPEFRRAEAQVLASLYFQVISGKHLAEIHMTYNLVEVALHNAFDCQDQWTHPFRTLLYLHLYSHELAEELTTEHLVQEGAVFNQIFATTHSGMINHLNNTYANFEYGTDEDFELRSKLMQDSKGEILPNSAIKWELRYAQIWKEYTDAVIHLIYADDKAVCEDKFLQDFHDGLKVVLLKGLPERYADFKTKDGVSRFAADTIHHMVIRHQVYGTTGIRAALDPRISKTMVPRDGSTYATNDWRSLAFVALATGKARFTLLINDFTYLLDDVDEKYRAPMNEVFNQLQEKLKILDVEWNTTKEELEFNNNYFRAVPSSLHTGAGY
jgi:hypothetical protein